MSRKSAQKINDFLDNDSVKIFGSQQFILIYVAIFAIFVLLLLRLFNLQIVDGEKYLAATTNNIQSQNIIRAPRGVFFDENGVKLAYNEKTYSVFISPFEFDTEDIVELESILNIDREEIENKLENDVVYGRATIKSDISLDEFLTISNEIKEIPGVYTEAGLGRHYIDNYLYSHIIGYLGDASEEDLSDNVDAFSRVGKTGLEKLLDSEIRGTDGVQVSEVEIGTGESKSFIPNSPTPGDNVYLTLNNEWQRLAYQVLADKVNATGGLGGGFVVMDVESGEIPVLVSYPTVDVQEFSNGISSKSFQGLLEDPRTPLLERTTNVAIPTGSIFKVLTGLMALEEGVVNTDTTFYSDGCMELPPNQQFCESFFRKLGNVDIYRAIKLSSNIYFCNVSLELEKSFGGIATFINYTDRFGIGKKTGIDLPIENPGAMATPQLKNQLLGEPWYSGDTCNVAIGQGLLSATPLQMAVSMAAIENGGKVLKPVIIDRLVNSNDEVVKDYETSIVNDISISKENIDIMKDAMQRAVRDSDGTVRGLSFYPDYIIGKTGTATSPVRIDGVLYNEPHAWVMGVFEKDGRRYAFTVNIAHGGWGEETVEVVERFLQGI